MSLHPNRRRLVLAVPMAAFAAVRSGTTSAQSTELKESDPEGVAFEYKADAGKVDPAKSRNYKPGQTCANCGLFFPQEGSRTGGCGLFMGKDVAAVGWCKAWEAKAKS